MTSVGWRPSGLLVESIRSTRAQGWRALLVVAASFSLFGAIAFAEASTVASVDAYRTQAHEVGVGVIVVSGAEGRVPAVSAHTCVRLGELDGVERAGVVRDVGVAKTAHTHQTVRRVLIGEAMWQLWFGPEARAPELGWMTSDSLYSKLQLQRGDPLRFVASDRTVHRVMGSIESGRELGVVGTWLLGTTAPIGLFDECWVEFEHPVRTREVEIVASYFPERDAVSVQPWISTNALSRDTAAEVRQRPTRHGWIVVALLAGVVYHVALIGRRRERALLAVLGMRRIDQFAAALYEVGVVAIVPGLSALAIVVGSRLTPAADPDGVSMVVEGSLLSLLLTWILLAASSVTLRRRSALLVDLK